jgi:amino acid transporter
VSEPAFHPEGAKLLSVESFGNASFGLRHAVLSPLETLAQSISTIAPSTSPTLTIPLVFASAGQGTAFAYLIAMGLMVLVGLCIASFARESSSPGSLYSYTRKSLPAVFSAITAWALFFAYITTASAVIGGFVAFAETLLGSYAAHLPAAVLHVSLVAFASLGAAWVAYRDVQISARLMLYIEAVSVCLIAVIIALTLYRHGLHLDPVQLDVRTLFHGTSGRGIGLGVMLAIFSFVGFESATTLGAEARNPLRTIPRAVIQSALLAGVFFVVCSYGETLGFHNSPLALDKSDAPFHFLTQQAGVGFLGVIIDVGVLISMFAATLACVIAASRVLLLMAHHGLAHKRLSTTHAHNETPGTASILSAVLAFLPAAGLALSGASGADTYNWMGTLAVYGFLTAYGLVAVALAFHLRHTNRLTLGSIALTASAALAMLLAMLSNLYPVPPSPVRYFPYIYAAYLAAALAWLLFAKPAPRPST